MAKPKPPFDGITPPYDILLRGSQEMPIGLYQLHLATAEQLCRSHYKPGCVKKVKARMKELVDHHYVQEGWTPTRRLRSPYHYVLGTAGIAYLREAGLDVPSSFRASKETDKQYLFIRHALEVNDVVIAAALLKRSVPVYYLDSFIHERVLKRKPYKAPWQGEKLLLIPDALLDFRSIQADSSQRRMPILLEHDRGTEEQDHFRRRIRAYIMLLKSEAYKGWFGVKSITIAFTTFEGEKRREQMREWTRQELAETNEPRAIGMTFCFASLTQPLEPRHLWLEPCWLAAYEEIRPIALLAAE
jgi:Replication-relaxation